MRNINKNDICQKINEQDSSIQLLIDIIFFHYVLVMITCFRPIYI